MPAPAHDSGAFVVLYLGLLGLLVVEQFVVRVPPLASIDVALLFGVVTVVVALGRARARLRMGGSLVTAALSVLPLASIGTVLGVVIAVNAGAEPTAAWLAGGLAFVAAFVGITASARRLAGRGRGSPERS